MAVKAKDAKRRTGADRTVRVSAKSDAAFLRKDAKRRTGAGDNRRIEVPALHCRGCGKLFPATRSDRRFCHPNCKRSYHRRNEVRGATVVPLLIEWRKTRGKGKAGGITDIAEIVDRWVSEDRALEKKAGVA